MRDANDQQTIDMFPPEVRIFQAIISPSKQEAKEAREAREAAKYEARRWVVVTKAGTDDEDVWDHVRFSTYHEALRAGSGAGVRFDVMFRGADGKLTMEY